MVFCHISDDGFLDEKALLLYNNVILKNDSSDSSLNLERVILQEVLCSVEEEVPAWGRFTVSWVLGFFCHFFSRCIGSEVCC